MARCRAPRSSHTGDPAEAHSTSGRSQWAVRSSDVRRAARSDVHPRYARAAHALPPDAYRLTRASRPFPPLAAFVRDPRAEAAHHRAAEVGAHHTEIMASSETTAKLSSLRIRTCHGAPSGRV